MRILFGRGRVPVHTAPILVQRLAVDSGRHGSAGEDLGLDLFHHQLCITAAVVTVAEGDDPVLRHCRIGVGIDFATDLVKGVQRRNQLHGTGSARGAGGAGSVHEPAQALRGRLRLWLVLRIGTARQIRVAGLVRDPSHVVNELVGTGGGAPLTRPGDVGAAVEYVLDAQVDVVGGSVAGDLDATVRTVCACVCARAEKRTRRL
jgi:hypothetical protein